MRRVILLFSIVFFSINIWHHVHSGPPSWDEAWYLETSFRLFYALKESVWLFIGEYVHAFGDRPPLIAVLPIPIYFLLGAGEKVGLLVNDVGLLLAGWSVYQIGKRLYGEVAGLMAVVSLWLMPVIYGLSRVYLVECWLMTLTCLTYWQLLEAKEAGKNHGIRLGLLLGLGMLVKPVFPLYVLGGAIVGWRVLVREWLYVFGVGLLVAMSWYVFNFEGMFGHVMSASWGYLSQDYGQPARVMSLSTLRDYEKIIREGLSWRTVVGGGVLGIVSLMRGRLKDLRWSWKEWYWSLWFIIPFVTCLFVYNRDVRFMSPSLPALAMSLGVVSAKIFSGRWGKIFLSAFLFLPLSIFSAQTFGLPQEAPLKFNGPPARFGQWERRTLLEDIFKESRGRSTLVGMNLSYPAFNHNNLTSLATLKKFPIRFIPVGSFLTEEEMRKSLFKDPLDYLVTVSGKLPSDIDVRLNLQREVIFKMMEKQEIPLIKISDHEVFAGVIATLYKIKKEGLRGGS